ncbi:MAG: YihY/virulence factor BrkB family protein [Proteobacteria bacterium]|nr:YihY/virulence factor BrkB family protein [Pseudomonadota bacterium]
MRSALARLWRFMLRVFDEFSQDHIPTIAAGITFFALLAIFPAIGAIVSLYGMFSDRASIAHDLALMSGFLPGGAITILNDELVRLAAQPPQTLSLTFLGSSLVALWSASGGFKALVDGLNVAYEVPEPRSFLQLSIEALIFTLTAIVLAACAVFLGVLLPEGIPAVIAWPVSFVVGTVVLEIVYRVGPNRPNAPRRWISWGSATASLLWLAGTQTFSWYVANYGSYNRVYGDLGAAVGFLTWLWLSVVILLLGAEINCERERLRSDPSASP